MEEENIDSLSNDRTRGKESDYQVVYKIVSVTNAYRAHTKMETKLVFPNFLTECGQGFNISITWLYKLYNGL